MSDDAKPARRYLDVPAVAAMFGMTTGAVQKLVQRGKIPHRRLGRRVFFDPQEIERWFSIKLPGVTPGQAKRAS